MKKYIAAIDQGTTSTRFIIFSIYGEIIAQSQLEHQQIFPKPGWVEHDPVEIWNNTKKVIKDALFKAGILDDEIYSIGITNQRETTVLWNKNTGIPVYNAIVWQDMRTDAISIKLKQTIGDEYFKKLTGLPIANYFSGLKIKWLLENIDGLFEKASKGEILFGNIDSWLIWNLTGGINGGKHITDVTNASRTMLMDLAKLSWSNEILEKMNIPIRMLPEIKPSSDVYGYASIEGIKGIPIAGDLGDQQAALFGQTGFEAGDAKNTYGTGCFLLMNTGESIVYSKHGMLTTVAYKIGNEPVKYALEGSIAVAGALVQWLRDNLGIIIKSADIEDLAKTVENNGDVYFVPAFSGLFAPYWRSDARGVIVGLTRYSNKGHVARAALESTAYQTRDVLEAMQKDSNVILQSLKVDGGMVQNNFLMQFQSDILGFKVIAPSVLETTALGAAYVAGLAVDVWKNENDLKKYWKIERTWQPEMSKEEAKFLYNRWKQAIERSYNWA